MTSARKSSRPEDLEVPADAAEEFGAGVGGPEAAAAGKPPALRLLRAVQHLPFLGDSNHPREAERAANQVPRQTLPPPPVTRRQPDAAVHAEPGMPPASHLSDDPVVDAIAALKQSEDLLAEDPRERLVVHGRQRDEDAARRERPVGDEGVDVRVPVDELPERLDGGRRPRNDVPRAGVAAAEHLAVHLEDGQPRQTGEVAEELPVEPEEEAKAFRNRADESVSESCRRTDDAGPRRTRPRRCARP